MDREEKYKRNMKCLDRWMTAHENGNNAADYLKTIQVKEIGIYGYGILGKHLVYELQKEKFPIQWIMDKRPFRDDKIYIVRPDDQKERKDVGLAVITALAEVEEIETFLSVFVTGQILSIEELIENLYRWGIQK